METWLLVGRLVLAAVFVVSGLTKLADGDGSRTSMREFGVPAVLAGPFGLLLPLAELAVAIALLPGGAATMWGSIGALALLVLFVAGIGFNLARGRRPDCHCFGQLSSEPIGANTIIRNVVLAAIAAAVVVSFERGASGMSALGWIGSLSVAERAIVALGAGMLALLGGVTWAMLQLLQQNGRILLRLDTFQSELASGGSVAPATLPDSAQAAPAAGLAVGMPAPAFSLTGLYGETLTLDALLSTGKSALLTFTDPNCGPCQALLPDMGRWQRELAPTLTMALISRGTSDENRAKGAEHGLTQVLLQQDREVMNSYLAYGTPSSVLVRPDHTIGSALAQGAEEIRALVARSASGNLPATLPMAVYPPAPTGGDGRCPNCGQVHDQQAAPAMPAGLAVGAPAPALKLPDLTGKTIDLADYRGRETVVLFWNTGCGFCQQMLPEIKTWESNRPADAPALLLVSAGGAEANQAQGLMSSVLLDDSFSAGSAFGASGTPSAVKVGSDGTIAAALAVGSPGVMAMLNNQPVPAQAVANAPAPAVRIGDAAPEFALPNLDGQNLSLASYRGKKTLLLFWNPGCGFCQQMLQDLRGWEVRRPADAPEILVVSTGAAQENRALGLKSPIVLDAAMSVGQQYGAMGTPMGVLIDAEGRIASEVAAGAPAVLALAGSDAAPS